MDAAEIDAITDELSILSELLEAKKKYRALDDIRRTKPWGWPRSVANEAACNALRKVLELESKLDDLRRSD